jgi:hypothetical protein
MANRAQNLFQAVKQRLTRLFWAFMLSCDKIGLAIIKTAIAHPTLTAFLCGTAVLIGIIQEELRFFEDMQHHLKDMQYLLDHMSVRQAVQQHLTDHQKSAPLAT